MNVKITKPMTMRKDGELISYRCGQIVTGLTTAEGNKLIADGVAVVYSEIVPEGTKNITSNGTHDVTQYAEANVVVGLNVDVFGLSGDVDLLGKTADELQTDVEVANGGVTGTLNYVTGYTGFSGDAAEQSGNYLAIKCTAVNGAVITVELINGTVGHPVTLDKDGMIVIRITDTSTQSVEVVATKDNKSEKISLSIADLTLAQA